MLNLVFFLLLISLIITKIVTAMGPPSTGNTVTPRFARHFNTVSIDEFNSATLEAIFSKIVLWHLDARYFLIVADYLEYSLIRLFCFAEDFPKNLTLVLKKSFRLLYTFMLRLAKTFYQPHQSAIIFST